MQYEYMTRMEIIKRMKQACNIHTHTAVSTCYTWDILDLASLAYRLVHLTAAVQIVLNLPFVDLPLLLPSNCNTFGDMGCT